jgi:hypothetical protein
MIEKTDKLFLLFRKLNAEGLHPKKNACLVYLVKLKANKKKRKNSSLDVSF